MNYYEHHLGDYLRATAHLSMLEDGAYRRLLDVYYSSEKPLPGDIKTVERLVRARSVTEKKAVTAVLVEFFIFDEDGFHKRRCDKDIARFHDKSKKAKSSANARWAKENGEAHTNISGSVAPKNTQRSQSERNADDMRTHSEGSAEAMLPVPSPQSPDPIQIQEDMGSARKRASRTRFPDDFAPNDSGVKAATDAGLNVQAELQRFRDHHEATGSLMASWQAAWRTWVGKAVEFGHGKPAKAVNGNTDWLVATGFPNIAEAQNCHCHIGNAKLFRNGKRIGVEP